MKLVHWPLMGGLLHLVQRGGGLGAEVRYANYAGSILDRTMLCTSAAYAVVRCLSVCPSVCLSVCPSVTFLYSVEASKHGLQTFFTVGYSHTILALPCQVIR